MSDAVSAIIQKQTGSGMPGMEKQQSQQTQSGRSFENVLQEGGQQPSGSQTNQSAPSIATDPRYIEMRTDLTNRINNLPNGVPSTSAILPDFLSTQAQLGNFKEAWNKLVMSGVNGSQSSGVIGKFTNVETEFNELNTIMRSDKNLSQGELLSLQARLYQVSQHIDVLSKVVDQMTSGVKTVLNTNV